MQAPALLAAAVACRNITVRQFLEGASNYDFSLFAATIAVLLHESTCKLCVLEGQLSHAYVCCAVSSSCISTDCRLHHMLQPEFKINLVRAHTFISLAPCMTVKNMPTKLPHTWLPRRRPATSQTGSCDQELHALVWEFTTTPLCTQCNHYVNTCPLTSKVHQTPRQLQDSCSHKWQYAMTRCQLQCCTCTHNKSLPAGVNMEFAEFLGMQSKRMKQGVIQQRYCSYTGSYTG